LKDPSSKVGWQNVDAAFLRLAEDRLDPWDWDKLTEATYSERNRIVNPKLKLLIGRWEPVSRQFDGRNYGLPFPVQLPRGIGTTDNEEKGIVNGALKITR
jgi:hypothetical protein